MDDNNTISRNVLILIVDDNPQNLQVLGALMEKRNYDTAMALSGPEALEYLKSERPDLILLDVMMPQMDGYQVCRRLKKDDSTKNIPVIFLTAKNDTESVLEGFDSGGVDYVTKPFNPKELMARVKTHIDLKRAREEVKTLRGLIPICANCKQVRDDKGFWKSVEAYIQDQTDAMFTHGICSECLQVLYPGTRVAAESAKKKEMS